jgi:hypothetical protein
MHHGLLFVYHQIDRAPSYILMLAMSLSMASTLQACILLMCIHMEGSSNHEGG